MSEMKDLVESVVTEKGWSAAVTARKPGTFPPRGIFTKSASEIARVMSSKKVSPNGIGSGIQMVQFFINRAGKRLAPDRKKELQKAIKIMQGMNK